MKALKILAVFIVLGTLSAGCEKWKDIIHKEKEKDKERGRVGRRERVRRRFWEETVKEREGKGKRKERKKEWKERKKERKEEKGRGGSQPWPVVAGGGRRRRPRLQAQVKNGVQV